MLKNSIDDTKNFIKNIFIHDKSGQFVSGEVLFLH